MNKETEVILLDDLGLNAEVTEEQVHYIYEELSEADKTSTDNLAAAEKETEDSNYTSEDNTVIEAMEEIPGVNVIPSNIADTVHEKEEDIKSVLNAYDLDDESTIQMLNLIEEYKAGKTDKLYSRLPKSLQDMVNGILLTETNGNIDLKYINAMRNSAAKMLIDDFINDAKISAAVDDFNAEMSSVINEMNTEYDNMMGDAIDAYINKIEEIRSENPEQAERIESIKKSFDEASTFNKQLEFAKRTSANKFNKFLNRYSDDVFYFNKKVNNNSFGIRVNNIEELTPIIKAALPQYTEEDIKKFIICICRTVGNADELTEIAYQYRMISSIYKYKFVAIDDSGEIIFENISKVIDVILT